MKKITICLSFLIFVFLNTSCENISEYFMTDAQRLERLEKQKAEEEKRQARLLEIEKEQLKEDQFIAARKIKMVDLDIENNNTVTISLTNISEETTYINSLVFDVKEAAYIQGDSLSNKDTITWGRSIIRYSSRFRNIFGYANKSNNERNHKIQSLKSNIQVSVLESNRSNDPVNGESNLFTDELSIKHGKTSTVILKEHLESIEFKLSGGLHYKDFSRCEKTMERVLPIDKIIEPHSVVEITFRLRDEFTDAERLYFVALETLVNYDYVERVALADFTFTAG